MRILLRSLLGGQPLHSGERLVPHQVSRTYEGKNGREAIRVEHCAGWEGFIFSAESVFAYATGRRR